MRLVIFGKIDITEKLVLNGDPYLQWSEVSQVLFQSGTEGQAAVHQLPPILTLLLGPHILQQMNLVVCFHQGTDCQ